MFAGCIERIANDACGDCPGKAPCHALLGSLFGAGRARERSPRPASPFLAFLGEVARAIETGARPRDTRFRREVEARLEAMLAAGPVRIEALARALGVSRQTLYRRLKAEGATFAEVLDGLRRRLALRLLREEGVSVKEAAWRLGFSDPAAFSRAFKRWTGTSPRDVRPQSG